MINDTVKDDEIECLELKMLQKTCINYKICQEIIELNSRSLPSGWLGRLL